mgnify:CR=1 FL=1
MTTTLVEDIGTLLKNAGVASTSGGYRLMYRDLAPVPSQAICVIPSGGQMGQGKVEIDYPGFQVLVRGSSVASSGLEAQVQAVNATLHLYDGTVNSRVYVNITRTGDVQYLGRDGNQRPLYSVNFLATRSRTT